jgi:hypothetical protein
MSNDVPPETRRGEVNLSRQCQINSRLDRADGVADQPSTLGLSQRAYEFMASAGRFAPEDGVSAMLGERLIGTSALRWLIG